MIARRWRIGVGVVLCAAALAALLTILPAVRGTLRPLAVRVAGRKSVEDRLRQFGDSRTRLDAAFARAGVAFPPGRVLLLGIKSEKRLVVFAGEAGGPLRLVSTYPVLAQSGGPGPKLREGDRQVPEGVYDVESLNPNSRFHVALRVGYPNEFDRAMAARDGRTNLGGDIMIHGSNGSVGCLAMGDEAAEDLFVLAAMTGIARVRVVLMRVDMRKEEPPRIEEVEWFAELYGRIREALREVP